MVALAGLDRVHQWFERGELVAPLSGGRADLVDLIRAIALRCDTPGIVASPQVHRVAGLIGPCDHLVFVLVDGLGVRLLHELTAKRDSFLRSAMAEELLAVFPSTTAVALTSLTTGEHPARHGIPGWWAYLPDIDTSIEVLPFVERFSKRSLGDLGADARRLFSLPSILPRFRRDQLVITRSYICDTTYSRYWAGGCRSVGYERIHQAIDLAIDRVDSVAQPSFTHVYLNQLDTLCHEMGVHHPEAGKLLQVIDDEIARLVAELGGRARVVVTADHGHVDAGEDRIVGQADPLMDFLRCPPSGESRTPLFHLKDDADADAFREAFDAAHGDAFALLSIDQVEALGLLGPETLSDGARDRFGDFMALAPGATTLRYVPEGPTRPHRHIGVHAGLTPAEMVVPLILA